MNCPVCNINLAKKSLRGVEIYECPNRHGQWFEKSRLAEAKDAVDDELSWLDFDLWKQPESYQLEWSERLCPVCDHKLVSMAYADTGVTVDTCKDGHGAWLDHGEFERIIRALEKEANSMDASDYARASLEEAKELITGNEGLSSEWHDFTHVVRLLEYRVLTEHPRLSNFLTAFYKANPLK